MTLTAGTMVGMTALVGRESELAQLSEHLDAAAQGDAQVVVIGGEAGIGKSRLLGEFTAAHTGEARVVVGNCLELGPDGPAFAPFAMVLRALIAELGTERVAYLAGAGLPDLALLAPELGAIADPDPLGRSRLFEAMATLIDHGGDDRPLVLVFEDLHWSDSSTRDLIRFLVGTIADAPVMFVLTYRRDEVHRSHLLLGWLSDLDRLPNTHRITLEPLTDSDVDTLVHALAGDVPARTQARIRQRSQGIPFFVEELAQCCEQDTSLIPESLRDLMLTRLDRLSGSARDVVRIASAASTQVDHTVLLDVMATDEDSLDASLREAVTGQVLIVDHHRTGYSFRHALMREAVHADLLPGEHARLHARYAEALQKSARPEQSGEIAHHWHSAHETERSFHWSLRAADYSHSIYAWQEEFNHLERALDLWDRLDDPMDLAGCSQVELLVRAGEAAADMGQADRSVALLDAAMAGVDVAGDPATAANLLIKRAAQCEAARMDALDDLDRALSLAGEGTHDRAAALGAIAAHQMLSGHFPAALVRADEALSAAGLTGDVALMGDVHNTKGCILFSLGHPKEALAHLEQARLLALEGGDGVGLLRYYANYSDVLIGAGRYGAAAEVSREGRAAAAERGWARTRGAFLAGNQAEAYVLAGDWDAALVTIDEALGLDPPPVTRAHLHLMRAIVRWRRGDREGSTDAAERAAERLGAAAGQPQYLMPMAALRAQMDAADGRCADALTRLSQAGEAAGPTVPTSSGWPFVWTWALLLDDAITGARIPEPDSDAATDQVRAVAQRMADVSEHAGWRALLTAQLAGSDSRLDLWASAVLELSAGEGLRFEQAYARIRLADELFTEGDRAAAKQELQMAWQIIEEMRADSLRPLAVRVAAAARVPLRPVRRNPDLLTGREREVLGLVAQGKSNRAISDELFISVKTTSVHVSNILAKLDVSSRTEAAAWAHENLVQR
jgi:DNA-binding CsgD family transcriptional regulator